MLPDILTYTLDDCERRPQNARRPTSFPLLYEDEREALSNLLIAAGEDKLPNYTSDRDGSPDRIIRFMWLPSFDPAVIVRLTKTSDQNWLINAVRLALESDSETVVARTERILSGAESDRLSQILEFDLPLDNPAKGCVGPDIDGSRWIAEGIEGEIYKYVDRASGDKEPLRRLGLEALHLTGWELGQIY